MLDNREKTTQIVDAIMQPKLQYLCKKYCNRNRYEFRCTIDRKWGNNHHDAQLCEWGNATYCWMLDDLASEKRVESFKQKDGQSFKRYILTILNSSIFIERFKDWRFGKISRVPDYIRVIDKDAAKIFWGMCVNENSASIAQRLGGSVEFVESIIEQINLELVRRKKTHLLSTVSNISINGEDDNTQELNLADYKKLSTDHTPENHILLQQVRIAFKQLNWREQLLIEAMIVDGVNAKSLIQSLRQDDIELIDGISANSIKQQQIYYMLRKSVSKLHMLLTKQCSIN